MSNISVFILDQNQHGYYIHGRSPNGTTDVNMKELLMSLYREANAMSGTRGLQEESNEQLFIMKTNQSFRRQYESLFQNYYVSSRSVSFRERERDLVFVECPRSSSNSRRKRTLHGHASSILSESQQLSLRLHRSFVNGSSLCHSESIFPRETSGLRISSSCSTGPRRSTG